jgi:hypothetical protein
MQYLCHRRSFSDLPFGLLMSEFRAAYPHLFEPGALDRGGLHAEAIAGMRAG